MNDTHSYGLCPDAPPMLRDSVQEEILLASEESVGPLRVSTDCPGGQSINIDNRVGVSIGHGHRIVRAYRGRGEDHRVR